MIRILTLSLAALLSLALSAGYADNDQDIARQALASGKIKPLQDILAILETKLPGHRVVKVEFEHDDGQYIYEIKIISAQGVLHEVEIDARNGAVLEIEVDD